MPDYSPYQKGVIRRYYEHSETLALQRLAEIVSDLYLADTAAKKKRLWARAEQALSHLECPVARRERILSQQDVEELAALLGELGR